MELITCEHAESRDSAILKKKIADIFFKQKELKNIEKKQNKKHYFHLYYKG